MKTKIILFLTIIMILLIIFVASLVKKTVSLSREKANLEIELDVKSQEQTRVVNSNGELLFSVNEYQKDIESLKKSKDSIEQKLYQEIEKLELKEKQVNKLIYIYKQASNTIVGDVIRDTIYLDSIIRISNHISFDDGFLKAQLSNDTVLKYQYSEELFLFDLKRKVQRKFVVWRWLGWKKIIDKNKYEVRSSNPNAEIKILRLIKTI